MIGWIRVLNLKKKSIAKNLIQLWSWISKNLPTTDIISVNLRNSFSCRSSQLVWYLLSLYSANTQLLEILTTREVLRLILLMPLMPFVSIQNSGILPLTGIFFAFKEGKFTRFLPDSCYPNSAQTNNHPKQIKLILILVCIVKIKDLFESLSNHKRIFSGILRVIFKKGRLYSNFIIVLWFKLFLNVI